MSKSSNRYKMPTQIKIWSFWYGDKKQIFEKLDIEIGECGSCFACGFNIQVQSCHIVAVSQGGSNECENLHLLCPNCHLETENLAEKFYWKWLKNQNRYNWESSLTRIGKKWRLLEKDETEMHSFLNQKKYKEAARWSLEIFDNITEKDIDEFAEKLAKPKISY